MLIPYDEWSKLYEAMRKAGINIHSTMPIYQLASNEQLLKIVKEQKEQILGNLRKRHAKTGKTLLEQIIDSAEKMRNGMAGKDPAMRNTLLSYVLLAMNGETPHDILVREALATIPELYMFEDDNTYILLNPTEDELRSIKLTHSIREQVSKIITELLNNTSILDIDLDTKNITLLGVKIPITRPEPLARLLFEIGRRDDAYKMVSSYIEDIVNKTSNISYYVEDVNFRPLDYVEFIIRKTAFNVQPEIDEIIKKASIKIKAKISYQKMELYDIYVEIDSDIGIIRIPHHEVSLDRIGDMVRSAVDSIDIFLRRDAPVVLAGVSEARRHGYRFYKAGYNTDKGLDISFEKETEISIGNKTGRIRATVRAVKEWPLSERVMAKIEVDTGSESLKPALLSRLKELGLDKEYGMYTPTITETGKTNIVITLSSTNLEHTSKIIDATSIIMKDVETLIKSIATQQARLASQKLSGENYIGLYATLTLLGAKNILDKISEYTGRTPTGIQRVLKNYLEKKGINVDPEVITEEPEKIVVELINKNILTFNENLEPLINGQKLVDLLEPIEKLTAKHNATLLAEMAGRKAIRLFYEINGESLILYMLNRSKPITIETIIKHIESGAPVEIEILKTEINGKTVWEQLPEQVKLRELKLLPIEQVVWIEKDETIPKTRTDYELIIEAVCRGDNPSRCTDYIVSTHPEYLRIPRTLRVVEHSGEKWIDAGMYRIQIQKITGGTAVFKVEEKLSGKTSFVKARSIREAVYKATIEETEEVSY